MAKIALSVMTVVLILDPADKKKSRNLSEDSANITRGDVKKVVVLGCQSQNGPPPQVVVKLSPFFVDFFFT